MVYDLLIVGGGAAGFFAAVETASSNQSIRILILEKSTKLLSKVKISGGGRCNVTHQCFEPAPLSKHYPRGQRELKKLFTIFQAADTVKWFERRGVEMVAEEDGRMFPITHQSQTIVNCFLEEAQRYGVDILTSTEVVRASPENGLFSIVTKDGKKFQSKKMLVAMGGHPQADAYHWIQALGHTIHAPIPSLFTFNDVSKEYADLMGVAVQDAEVRIIGTKYASSGPVLITHWGLSGPAVIRLSAWAAEHLDAVNYVFTAQVNWTGDQTEESIRNLFRVKNRREGRKRISSHPLFHLPQRLWSRLCGKAGVSESMVWAEASAKSLNRLLEFLIRCPFAIKGKTTFKEEFVTCGGVDMKEINLTTMESKIVPGVFFAGEVLNVDGETGGFNFQAAWTTAYVAASSIAKKDKSPS